MPSNPINSSKPKSRNWLLAKSRQWHLWGGLIAGMFILIAGSSGIVLNYKKPIFTAVGLEEKPRTSGGEAKQKTRPAGLQLNTATRLAAASVSPDRALEIARAEWGEVALERIELKKEQGEWIYKLKQKGGDELWVNAATGSHFVKGAYERIVKGGTETQPARQTDWGKILLDLHTGKIGGDVGKAIMSIAALMLLFLTTSGVYLWIKPILIRRQNAKARAVSADPVAAAAVTRVPVGEPLAQ
jgi:uncharacterized iron-regulated membrane protein